MSDRIIVQGLVATVPRHLVTSENLPITSFRLASTQRRLDRATGTWRDGDTNWFTVTGFRQLALNASLSLKKGDRVLVVGRLKVRAWERDGRSGTTVEIEADAMGPDLTWGTATYARTIAGAGAGAGGAAVESAADGDPASGDTASGDAPGWLAVAPPSTWLEPADGAETPF